MSLTRSSRTFFPLPSSLLVKDSMSCSFSSLRNSPLSLCCAAASPISTLGYIGWYRFWAMSSAASRRSIGLFQWAALNASVTASSISRFSFRS